MRKPQTKTAFATNSAPNLSNTTLRRTGKDESPRQPIGIVQATPTRVSSSPASATQEWSKPQGRRPTTPTDAHELWVNRAPTPNQAQRSNGRRPTHQDQSTKKRHRRKNRANPGGQYGRPSQLPMWEVCWAVVGSDIFQPTTQW